MELTISEIAAATGAQLEDELAQAHEVIKGYHDSVLKELDLDEKEELADLQFEKGVDCSAE